MRILVLGFFHECEYIASMCNALRGLGDVIFVPAFRMVHVDKRRDVYYQLYRLASDADLVFWQCLHALHTHEVTQIIKRTNGKNILVSLDDDRLLAAFDPEHLLRTKYMDLVLTASITNVTHLGRQGKLIHPPIFWGTQEQLVVSESSSFFTIPPQKELPSTLYAQASEVISEHLQYVSSPIMGGIFVNIFQPRFGGPTQDMLRCLLLGITVISPCTPDLEAFFTPGEDFIRLDVELFPPTLTNHQNTCGSTKVTSTFDQLLTLTFGEKPRMPYPFVPNRTILLFDDEIEEQIAQATFDKNTYQIVHHLKLDPDNEDAWKHYCYVGYPAGFFYCAHRHPQNFRNVKGEFLGPGNMALVKCALMAPSPFAFLEEALRLQVDPLPAVKLLVEHGAGVNPKRRRCRILSGALRA